MPDALIALPSTPMVQAGAFAAGLAVGMAAAQALLVLGPVAAVLALLALAAMAGLVAHDLAAAWQLAPIAD